MVDTSVQAKMTWGLYGQFGLKVELDTKLTCPHYGIHHHVGCAGGGGGG